MNPWLQRFIQGFSFQIYYPTLVYITICIVALVGALIGSLVSDGNLIWIIIFGAGFYIAGRIVAWVKYRAPGLT